MAPLHFILLIDAFSAVVAFVSRIVYMGIILCMLLLLLMQFGLASRTLDCSMVLCFSSFLYPFSFCIMH